MAQGWNQYYHNPAPLSSDPGTLSRTSDTDRALSQHVENFIGHHEFSNPVDSLETPLQNSDYHTSYCPDSRFGNTSSDCVYQRYCNETQWQTGEEQMGKDFLQRCASSDIPDFATDGLQTPDLQGFKEDSGMLTPSFLGNYSDVSSSSDTGETRPSCDYHASNLLAGPKANVLTEHSSSDWFSPHAGSMSITSANPSMSASDVIFPSNMKTKENEVLCMQDMMENPEKMVESFAEQTSATPYMTSAKNNTVHIQNDFCLTHEGSERDFTQDQCADISMTGHGNKDVIDSIDTHTDDYERELTSTAGTITPSDNREDHFDQNIMQKETNQDGLEHINYAESKVGVTMDDKQAKEGVLLREKAQSGSATNSLSSDDSIREVGQCNSTNFSNNDEVESSLPVPIHSSDKTSHDDAGSVPTHVTESQGSDANVTSFSEFCFESKKGSTDGNLDQHQDSKNLSVMPNASISPESSDICDRTSQENPGSTTTISSSSVESCSQSNGSSVNANTQRDEQMSVEPEKTTTTLLEDPNCSSNVSSPVKTDETKKTDCSITNDTHMDTSQEKETNSQEQITKMSFLHQDSSGSSAQGTSFWVNTSDGKGNKDSLLPEPCSEPVSSDGEKHSCKEMETPTALESTSTTSLEGPDGESITVTSDNNQNVLSNSESHLQPNASSTDMNSCSEMEGKSSYADRQSPHKSLVAKEPPILCEDIAESERVSFEDMDFSTEDTSVLSTLYGEPLSGEDSSCETDKAKVTLNQYDKTSVDSQFHSDRQEPRLKSSAQLRKRLHPIVKLSTLETTIEAIDSYQCEKCGHTSSTVDLLIEHHHQSHKMEDFQFCETCNLYQLNGEKTENHLCGIIVKNPCGPLKEKWKKKANFGRKKCFKCGIQFRKHYHYVSHMRKHSGITPYRCDQCGSYFSQNCSLTKHKKVPGRCKLSNLPVTCSDADISENQTPPLPQKNKTQDKQSANIRECYVKLVDIAKTNLCGICGKSFCSVAKAKKHRRAIHKIRSVSVLLKQCSPKVEKDIKKKHKCPLCPTFFKYSYNRARHLRICVKEAVWGGKNKVKGKYCCPLCQASFTLPRNRYRHIHKLCLPECINRLAKENENFERVVKQHNPHDSEQGIQQKRNATTRHEQREQHVLNLTANKPTPPYKCNLCPAVFYHYSGRFRHMKKHELFKHSGKTVYYRKSRYSYMCNPKSLSSSETSHVAEKSTKPKDDNISTEAKEDCLKLTESKQNFKSTEANADHALNCLACGKGFDSSTSLEKHRCNYFGERPYRCLECGKRFKRHAHLIVHKNVHQRRIQCTVCKRILPTIGELIKHRDFHSKKGMLKCPDCNLQFQYPAHLLKHFRTHEKKVNKAPQPEETKPQQSLQSTKEQREFTPLQCSLCKEEFDDAQVLRKHCLTHISGSSSNQCPFCQRHFGNRNSLLRHMIKHTGDKALSCPHCGKQFYRVFFMELHCQKCHKRPAGSAKISMKKMNKQCSYCPRAFFRKNRLKSHLRGHQNNSLHVCNSCGQYYGINKIKQHQNECMKTATQDSSLSSPDGRSNQSLQSSRQDVKKMPLQSKTQKLLPFKCSHCTQRFRFKSLYLRHLVTHTGLQPYKCMHCDHRFASKTMCLQHEAFCDGMNKDGSSKPKSEIAEKQLNMPRAGDPAQTAKADGDAEFKCKFCTKSFVKPRSLRRHILTHNEVKPYRCKACDCCFSRYDHLKVHQTRCKGRRRRLEVCIPKVSLADVGKGWQIRFGAEPSQKTDMFKCEVCSQTFSNQTKLSRHITVFHTAKLFKCTRCGSAFSHEKSLKKHRKIKRCKKTSQESAASPPQSNSQVGNVRGQIEGMRNKILERIQPFLTKKYRYLCSYCPRGFESRAHLDVHIRLHTGERPFSCKLCGQGFIRKDYLHRHYIKCTTKQKKSKGLCDRCGSFFSSSQLENHKRACKPTSDSTAAVEQTKQRTTGSPPKGFSCAYCKSRFLLFSQLQEHFLTTHKLDTVGPPESTASLQQHLSNMPEIKEEPADESCVESLSDGSNLAMELDSTPDRKVSKTFSCSVCNMSFASKAGLMSHLRTHKSKEPFTCKICNRGFWNKTLCRNHYRKCRKGCHGSRHAEGPLKAKLDFALNDSVLVFKDKSKTTGTGVLQTNFSCKDNATDESEQESEENKEQGSSSKEKKEVQYQCSECDQSFTDGLMLISHLEDHGRQEQEKKRNTCTRCGRVCSTQGNLEKHMKMHGMIKKHCCPQCFKTFYTTAELQDHMTCHDPSRPYCCRVCCQRFLTRQSICNHYREEHKGDVLSCQLCSKAYATKKSLARHYRDSHRNEQKGLGNTEDKNNEEPRQDDTSGESDKGANSDSEDSDSDSAPYFPCHVCGKTFKTSESLEDHQLCHLGKKPHECAECGKCFYQASQLQQHQRMHRSEFQCQICGKGCVSLFALRKHKHSHGKSHPYRCSKCHLSFKGSSQLAEHMSTHREDNFPCDICDQVFQSKSSRAEHRKSHTNSSYHPGPSVLRNKEEPPSQVSETSIGYSSELKYRCSVCHECFKNPEELSEHGCIKAKERPYYCNDCDKHFLHASHLKNHRTTHLPSLSKSEYTCNQCNIVFSSTGDFLSHLKNHVDIVDAIKRESDEEDVGPSPTFICPVCSHCFPSPTELIYHFPTHSHGTFPGEKLKEQDSHNLTLDGEIKCPNCFQTFWGVNALWQHHCPHEPQAPAQADMPSLSSPAYCRATQEEEEVDVTGDDQYTCPICPSKFSSKHGLMEHQVLHHFGEKPFKCDVCGSAFAQRRYLTRHMNRHKSSTGHSQTSNASQHKSKDFKCLQCGKKFSTVQNLSIHMRLHAQSHAGDYRCDMCYKSFSHWVLLRQHQESHMGQVVYECTECDKAFAFPHLLEEHQQTHAGSSQ